MPISKTLAELLEAVLLGPPHPRWRVEGGPELVRRGETYMAMAIRSIRAGLAGDGPAAACHAKVAWQTLRHTFASQLVAAGVPIY